MPLPTLVPTLAPSLEPEPTATPSPRPVPSYAVATVAGVASALPTVLLVTRQILPPAVTVMSRSPTIAVTQTLTPTKKPEASPLPTETTVPPPSATAKASLPAEQSYFFPVKAKKANTISYGAEHHDYPATDIFCPIGSTFVAPTNGVIDFVSREDVWDAATDQPALRGGISVAMIGDDGVRYYGSHLSQVADGIELGVRVEAGQALGLTGKSGNARSTPAHLHFGISHPTTPDDWQTRRGEISPYRYLKAWQRGEMLTPDVSSQ